MIVLATSSLLRGRRILLVEDEPLVALLEEDLLVDAGATVVGPASNVSSALELIEADGIDGAVLDVNLGAELVFRVADRLAADGVPFVFVTGYGQQGLNQDHRTRPTILKPFRPEEFARLVASGLIRPGSAAG